MICNHCENEVSFVIYVVKQLYSVDNLESGIANEYWCMNCIQNSDSDLGGDTKVSIK